MVGQSSKQPARVEFLVCFGIVLSFRCQCPEDLSCESKGSQTISCDNTSITHCRRRPIEFFTTIVRDIFPDKVLAVAPMQTIVEHEQEPESQHTSPRQAGRTATMARTTSETWGNSLFVHDSPPGRICCKELRATGPLGTDSDLMLPAGLIPCARTGLQLSRRHPSSGPIPRSGTTDLCRTGSWPALPRDGILLFGKYDELPRECSESRERSFCSRLS